MRTSTVIMALSGLVAAVSAAPAPANWRSERGAWGWGRPGVWHHGDSYDVNPNDQSDQCLTDEDAQAAADIFRQLIQDYSDELALEALTEDFTDYTSSVNIIRNRGAGGPIAVNGVSFSPRQAFMDAQGSQPPIPFETLNVFHGCNTTSMRWQTLRSANGQKTETQAIPVVGLAVLETVPADDNQYGFRVKTLFSEFNAAAWLVNNGVFKPNSTIVIPPPTNETVVDVK